MKQLATIQRKKRSDRKSALQNKIKIEENFEQKPLQGVASHQDFQNMTETQYPKIFETDTKLQNFPEIL
mgnify:CR=1 FL=1